MAKKKSKVREPLKIDILTDVTDPQKFPWPYKDGSVAELTCQNVLEYVPGKQRGRFMDEIYRILIDDGKAGFTVRYWNTAQAMQDYRYEWPPLCEQSFLYFNRGWREANKLDLGIECDFDFTYGYIPEADTANRSDDVRSFNLKYYGNVVQALQLVLTKRPKGKK